MRDGRQPPPNPNDPYFAAQLAELQRRQESSAAMSFPEGMDIPGTGSYPAPLHEIARVYSLSDVLYPGGTVAAGTDGFARYNAGAVVHSSAPVPASPGSPPTADTWSVDTEGRFGPSLSDQLGGTNLVEVGGRTHFKIRSAFNEGGGPRNPPDFHALTFRSPSSDALFFNHDDPGCTTQYNAAFNYGPGAQCLSFTFRYSTNASGQVTYVPVSVFLPGRVGQMWRWGVRFRTTFTAPNGPDLSTLTVLGGALNVAMWMNINCSTIEINAFNQIYDLHLSERLWRLFQVVTGVVQGPPVSLTTIEPTYLTEGFGSREATTFGTTVSSGTGGSVPCIIFQPYGTGGMPNTGPTGIQYQATIEAIFEAWPLDYYIGMDQTSVFYTTPPPPPPKPPPGPQPGPIAGPIKFAKAMLAAARRQASRGRGTTAVGFTVTPNPWSAHAPGFQSFVASGGTAPYTWLSTSSNTAVCTVSSPTSSTIGLNAVGNGTATITTKATDAHGLIGYAIGTVMVP